MEATAPNLLMPHNYIKKTLKDKTKILWIIEKDSKIKPYPSCLGNISKDFSVTNMKKKEQGIRWFHVQFHILLIIILLVLMILLAIINISWKSDNAWVY